MATQPMPKTISATEASNRFGTMIDEASRGRSLFIVTRMGQPRAIILGFEQYLELLEEGEFQEVKDDPTLRSLMSKAQPNVELGRAVTLDELDKK